MVLTWLLAGWAWAAGPADVVQELGRDAKINWSAVQLEVVGTSATAAPGVSRSAREQTAIGQAQAALSAWVGAVPLLPGQTSGALPGFDAARAVERWAVIETRYSASGVVEVVAAVDLRAAFAPWSLSRSVQAEVKPPQGPSGVVIDARGLAVPFSFSPQLVSEAGELLYDGALWRTSAFDQAPAVWVTTAAAPAARVAGTHPAVFVARSVVNGAVVLGEADAHVWRTEVAGTQAAGAGTVVVVVDSVPATR